MGPRCRRALPLPQEGVSLFPHLKLPRRTRSLPPGRAGRGGRGGWGGRGSQACAGDGRPAPGTRRGSVPGQHVTLPRWVPPPSQLLAPGGRLQPPGGGKGGPQGRETRPSPRGQPQLGPRAQAPEMGGWADGQSSGRGTEDPGQEEEGSWRKCSGLENSLPAWSPPWDWAPCPWRPPGQ